MAKENKVEVQPPRNTNWDRIKINFKNDGRWLLIFSVDRYEITDEWLIVYRKDFKGEHARIRVSEIQSFYWTPELSDNEKENQKKEEENNKPGPLKKSSWWNKRLW